MGRRAIVGWDEEDAYTAWRHLLCYLDNRAGAVKYIKRKTHRRERREAKRAIRNGEA
jgi:hypothetical protein